MQTFKKIQERHISWTTRLTTNIKFNYLKKTTYVYGVMMSSAAAMAPSRLKEPTSSHPCVGDSALNSCTLKKIKSSTSDFKIN